ncbi:ATP-dependent RNA helicase [Marinomonas sp. MED121]|uniref:DEAD/DEAH box helicase n=1 Tax=Marinomonas sp. MED121 TaxID=314277 RepID=UPI000068FA43|nr:DEAD/DEAH box helicase [Marinomonas sp. MED121]EAQ64196.1 ATP-dependent RNA helicase [Marinomonas sp. MED121]
MSFSELELDPTIEQAIIQLGFKEPTEIQTQGIPVLMDGEDLLASAPTGTGKTLSFCAPAVQHILDRDEASTNAPKALILAPTRELARQIFNLVKELLIHTRIQPQLIVGGTPYGMQQQQLSEDCDILVATPGRLKELDDKQWLDLSDVSYFVIDEADRMLDMGFADTITALVKELPKERQTAMLSATLDGDKLGQLADKIFKQTPEAIQINDSTRTIPSQIKQIAYRVDDDAHKEAIVKHLLKQEGVQQALLFVSNRDHVDVWVNKIRALHIMCSGLHGVMKQGDRSEHMKQMQKGRLQVLVATDVAARGIDLPEINTVINLRLPQKSDSYVHRAGRASRDGNEGTCISLIDSTDLAMMEKIQRYMQSPIKFGRIEGLEAKTKVRSPATKSKKKKAPKLDKKALKAAATAEEKKQRKIQRKINLQKMKKALKD